MLLLSDELGCAGVGEHLMRWRERRRDGKATEKSERRGKTATTRRTAGAGVGAGVISGLEATVRTSWVQCQEVTSQT